jgi:hypothetical protein
MLVNDLLDLLFRESQLNVHAGEREVRPPPAPTFAGSMLRPANPFNFRTEWCDRRLCRTLAPSD